MASTPSTFTSDVMARIQRRYGAAPEFLWKRTPDNAIFRHPENGKWFAAVLLNTPRRVLDLPGSGALDILNLKCEPKLKGSLLDGRRIFPGYHMNKEHWITLVLDGSVPWEEIKPLVEMNHLLTAAKK